MVYYWLPELLGNLLLFIVIFRDVKIPNPDCSLQHNIETIELVKMHLRTLFVVIIKNDYVMILHQVLRCRV